MNFLASLVLTVKVALTAYQPEMDHFNLLNKVTEEGGRHVM